MPAWRRALPVSSTLLSSLWSAFGCVEAKPARIEALTRACPVGSGWLSCGAVDALEGAGAGGGCETATPEDTERGAVAGRDSKALI